MTAVPWHLSLGAQVDVLRIYQVYALGIVKFGGAAVERYRAELESGFTMLAALPGLGRETSGAGQSVRFHFHAGHLIVYMVEPQGILIVRVLPGRDDWRAHL